MGFRCFLLGLLASAVGAGSTSVPGGFGTRSYSVSQPASNWTCQDEVVNDINKAASRYLPMANTKIQTSTSIPASIGKWGPKPCQAVGSKYGGYLYKGKAGPISYTAEWLGGLRSGRIESLVATCLPAGRRGMEVRVSGKFASLPLQLKVTTWPGIKVWDNHNDCCGSNRHFYVSMNLYCSSNPSGNPLDRIEVTNVNIDKLEITEKIFGILKINVKDLTHMAEKLVKDAGNQEAPRLTEFLNTDTEISVQALRATMHQFCFAPEASAGDASLLV